MADSKYATGGKLSLGTKTYGLEADENGNFDLDGTGEFDGYTFTEAEIDELVEAGATYEAPEGAEEEGDKSEAAS